MSFGPARHEGNLAVKLKGLTWDHPRGYAPLIAGAREYQQSHPDVEISWDRRTLREFGEAPIEQYADRYDLIVIDHPFTGFAAAHDVLVDLARYVTLPEPRYSLAIPSACRGIRIGTAEVCGRFRIDAATQVACYRPDLLAGLSCPPPKTFEDVLNLAATARAHGQFVIVPACPIDAISLVFTLSANLGHPISEIADSRFSKAASPAKFLIDCTRSSPPRIRKVSIGTRSRFTISWFRRPTRSIALGDLVIPTIRVAEFRCR
jgi:hypothetical protein